MADVEKIKKHIKQLEAQVKRVEALEKTKERKKDTRRKIIAGGALLALAERDPQARKNIFKCLDESVINPKDRALFDLPTLSQQPSPPPSESVEAAVDPVSAGTFQIQPDTDI